MKCILKWAALLALPLAACQTPAPQLSNKNASTAPKLLSRQRQLTFSGLRAGEGYFSPDGLLMIFQSEREKENPFYQMYVMNMATGKTERVSPGYGKTTCGWIHPNKKSVIFASTHGDPEAKAKQRAELDDRAKGVTKRYAWDYDENYDIYSADLKGGSLKNLTRSRGYDAEGAISPDGQWIVFASNRDAYTRALSEDEKKILAKDPSYFMDIYLMKIDGTQVRRLTTSPGYDGGPFFSPDGKRIVWRRFAANGATAEVFTMAVDGTDEKQITRLNAMSWAPFYHPSGDYIIFTTNLHGYDNFELYIVDAEGRSNPVRVTNLEGFDGLPVFLPNGRELTWNRKLADGTSQIFIADWDDEAARALLGLPGKLPSPKELASTIEAADLQRIVNYLAAPELRGRATGSPEEAAYTQQIADYFAGLGLKPLKGTSFIQEFPFVKDAKLGANNNLILIQKGQSALELGKDWLPLAFSQTGEIPATEIVFAGYGITAPAQGDQQAYDSFAGLDLKDKWALVFRYIPEKASADRKQYLQRYSKLEHKAMLARNLGARGIIFVSGPTSQAKDDLIPFKISGGGSGEMSLAAVSITDKIAAQLFEAAGKDLATTQKELDKGENFQGFPLTGAKLAAKVDVRPVNAKGRNVLALLKTPGAQSTLIIGAHGDHLGEGHSESSLMRSADRSLIHTGADDNASGVAAVLEMAAALRERKQLKQNILFAVWSGEELGNLGSSFFLQQSKRDYKWLKPSAYINLDMVGRLRTTGDNEFSPVSVQGLGSSDRWAEIIESVPKPLPMTVQQDPYLPTDAMAFYVNGVPVLNFFSGVHEDYHSPRDTADKINYAGLAKITELALNIAATIAENNLTLPYRQSEKKDSTLRRGFRLFLGTIPDYSSEGIKGVKISGVVKGGPAEKAGLRNGDIIVEFANMKIENINDYVFSLQSATPNTPTTIVVLREGQRAELSITPQTKE